MNINSVCWSPDGSKLAISALNKAGNNDLYILDINNDQLQKLTNDFYDDRTPIWTPNGEMLIFSSDRTIFGYNGSYNLFLYDLKTANIQYLTYGKENYFSPCISPNGKSLVFVSDFDGAQNVWMMKIESGGNGSRLSNGMKKITRFATEIGRASCRERV